MKKYLLLTKERYSSTRWTKEEFDDLESVHKAMDANEEQIITKPCSIKITVEETEYIPEVKNDNSENQEAA